MPGQKVSFVVFSAGRTGGHLITKNLTKQLSADVFHTHNPLLTLPNINTVPVISRRNIFDAIISMFVATEVKQFHWVDTNTVGNIDPFYIDPIEFSNMFSFQTSFYKVIEQRQFKNSVDVYYEDIIADRTYLSSRLGYNFLTEDLLSKSPYDAKSCVTNINELTDLYSSLCDKGISDVELDMFINSVELDLEMLSKKNFDLIKRSVL